ncbi:unnamed protein product [Discula destructiva]
MSLHTPTTPSPPSETLTFPDIWASQLAPYLPLSSTSSSQPTITTTTTTTTTPSPAQHPHRRRPFVTLTYAQSLDSHLSLGPGLRTTLSGPATKAMTHFLRAHHAAILVGVGTACADDPGLNCRLAKEGGRRRRSSSASPRPVVLDPGARWDVGEASKVVRLAREGTGAAPWVLYAAGVEVDGGRRAVVEGVGGRYVPVPVPLVEVEAGGGEGGGGGQRPRLGWEAVLGVLSGLGVVSVMVEGGGRVINDLLALSNGGVDVVDSVVVTVAPVWLGAGGVAVAPARVGEGVPGPRLGGVTWVQMGEDAVLCGRIQR